MDRTNIDDLYVQARRMTAEVLRKTALRCDLEGAIARRELNIRPEIANDFTGRQLGDLLAAHLSLRDEAETGRIARHKRVR